MLGHAAAAPQPEVGYSHHYHHQHPPAGDVGVPAGIWPHGQMYGGGSQNNGLVPAKVPMVHMQPQPQPRDILADTAAALNASTTEKEAAYQRAREWMERRKSALAEAEGSVQPPPPPQQQQQQPLNPLASPARGRRDAAPPPPLPPPNIRPMPPQQQQQQQLMMTHLHQHPQHIPVTTTGAPSSSLFPTPRRQSMSGDQYGDVPPAPAHDAGAAWGGHDAASASTSAVSMESKREAVMRELFRLGKQSPQAQAAALSPRPAEALKAAALQREQRTPHQHCRTAKLPRGMNAALSPTVQQAQGRAREGVGGNSGNHPTSASTTTNPLWGRCPACSLVITYENLVQTPFCPVSGELHRVPTGRQAAGVADGVSSACGLSSSDAAATTIAGASVVSPRTAPAAKQCPGCGMALSSTNLLATPFCAVTGELHRPPVGAPPLSSTARPKAAEGVLGAARAPAVGVQRQQPPHTANEHLQSSSRADADKWGRCPACNMPVSYSNLVEVPFCAVTGELHRVQKTAPPSHAQQYKNTMGAPPTTANTDEGTISCPDSQAGASSIAAPCEHCGGDVYNERFCPWTGRRHAGAASTAPTKTPLALPVAAADAGVKQQPRAYLCGDCGKPNASSAYCVKTGREHTQSWSEWVGRAKGAALTASSVDLLKREAAVADAKAIKNPPSTGSGGSVESLDLLTDGGRPAAGTCDACGMLAAATAFCTRTGEAHDAAPRGGVGGGGGNSGHDICDACTQPRGRAPFCPATGRAHAATPPECGRCGEGGKPFCAATGDPHPRGVKGGAETHTHAHAHAHTHTHAHNPMLEGVEETVSVGCTTEASGGGGSGRNTPTHAAAKAQSAEGQAQPANNAPRPMPPAEKISGSLLQRARQPVVAAVVGGGVAKDALKDAVTVADALDEGDDGRGGGQRRDSLAGRTAGAPERKVSRTGSGMFVVTNRVGGRWRTKDSGDRRLCPKDDALLTDADAFEIDEEELKPKVFPLKGTPREEKDKTDDTTKDDPPPTTPIAASRMSSGRAPHTQERQDRGYPQAAPPTPREARRAVIVAEVVYPAQTSMPSPAVVRDDTRCASTSPEVAQADALSDGMSQGTASPRGGDAGYGYPTHPHAMQMQMHMHMPGGAASYARAAHAYPHAHDDDGDVVPCEGSAMDAAGPLSDVPSCTAGGVWRCSSSSSGRPPQHPASVASNRRGGVRHPARASPHLHAHPHNSVVTAYTYDGGDTASHGGGSAWEAGTPEDGGDGDAYSAARRLFATPVHAPASQGSRGSRPNSHGTTSNTGGRTSVTSAHPDPHQHQSWSELKAWRDAGGRLVDTTEAIATTAGRGDARVSAPTPDRAAPTPVEGSHLATAAAAAPPTDADDAPASRTATAFASHAPRSAAGSVDCGGDSIIPYQPPSTAPVGVASGRTSAHPPYTHGSDCGSAAEMWSQQLPGAPAAMRSYDGRGHMAAPHASGGAPPAGSVMPVVEPSEQQQQQEEYPLDPHRPASRQSHSYGGSSLHAGELPRTPTGARGVPVCEAEDSPGTTWQHGLPDGKDPAAASWEELKAAKLYHARMVAARRGGKEQERGGGSAAPAADAPSSLLTQFRVAVRKPQAQQQQQPALSDPRSDSASVRPPPIPIYRGAPQRRPPPSSTAGTPTTGDVDEAASQASAQEPMMGTPEPPASAPAPMRAAWRAGPGNGLANLQQQAQEAAAVQCESAPMRRM